MLSACVHAPQGDSTNLVPVIQRRPSYVDSVAVARRVGSLLVVVRAVNRPAETISNVQVVLRDSLQRDVRKGLSDVRGVVVFDNVPVATYTVRLLAIGFVGFSTRARVTGGCRTDVEAYLTLAFTGIGAMPAVTAPRATMTLCDPGARE